MRRERELAILESARGRGITLGGSIHNHAVNACILEFFDGRYLWNDEACSLEERPTGPDEFNRKALAALWRRLRQEGVPCNDARALKAAVFVDFDGSEFDIWVDELDWGPTFFSRWFGWLSQKEWRVMKSAPLEAVLKPYHIYVDVTDLDMSGLQEIWPHIEYLQSAMQSKPSPPRRGSPSGLRRLPPKVLCDMTWEQVRELVRQKPSDLNRVRNRYVDESVARRRARWAALHPGAPKAPDNNVREWRRKAQNNFYSQVIRHPSMRALNLRPARLLGGPRKA